MPTLLPLWRATRTTGKQCGLTATGDYQPSLRSPWLAARECKVYAAVAEKTEITRKFCVPGICPETKKKDAENAEKSVDFKPPISAHSAYSLRSLRPLFTSYSC
ncbi:MAG: hypothetical protein ROD09_13870 [Candidatus Sedimenticola sp. (ex Thyasira tokunagai)]